MAATSYALAAGGRTLSAAGVAVLALSALDLGLETGLVLPALPVLAEHYDASLVAVTWLVTGFPLAAIVSMPLLGRLGDLYGKRRMLLVSLAAFAAGSLLCALTGSIELAIAGRLIQGLGAASAPLALGLIRDGLPPERVPRGIGVVVGASIAGGAVGLLLSGLLIESFAPPAIVWFLFLVAAVLAAATATLVPESAVRAEARPDLAGAATLALGLVGLLLAISKGDDWGWGSGRTVGLLIASAALLAAFVLVERRAAEPLVDLTMVAARPLFDAHVCAFVYGFSFLLAILLLPLMTAAPTATGYGLGLSTIGIGLVLFPIGATALLAGWAAGRAVGRVGPRALVAAGAVLGSATYVSYALWHDSRAALAVAGAALGIALGLTITGVFAVVVHGADVDKTGVAVGVNLVARNVALTVGAQVAAAIVTGAGAVGGFPADAGYTRAFLMAAAGGGVLLLASLRLPARPVTAIAPESR